MCTYLHAHCVEETLSCVCTSTGFQTKVWTSWRGTSWSPTDASEGVQSPAINCFQHSAVSISSKGAAAASLPHWAQKSRDTNFLFKPSSLNVSQEGHADRRQTTETVFIILNTEHFVLASFSASLAIYNIYLFLCPAHSFFCISLSSKVLRCWSGPRPDVPTVGIRGTRLWWICDVKHQFQRYTTASGGRYNLKPGNGEKGQKSHTRPYHRRQKIPPRLKV